MSTPIFVSSEVLGLVPKRLHDQFREFAATGSLADEIEGFLNNDPNGQKAVERLATEQLESLRRFGESLRTESLEPGRVSEDADTEQIEAPREEVAAFEIVTRLRREPPDRRVSILDRAQRMVARG